MSDLAYAMVRAYQKTKTQGSAVELVKKKFADANLDVMYGMWAAIDAYKDINE